MQTIAYSDVAGSGAKQLSFDEVGIEAATNYAAEDADVTLRLADALAPKLEEAGATALLGDVELPLARVLARMERTGVRINVARLSGLREEFAARTTSLTEEIHTLAGEPFDQLAQAARSALRDAGAARGPEDEAGYSTARTSSRGCVTRTRS